MTRLAHAWRALEREQRHAALAALGLFLSMFLPWYSKADTFLVHGTLKHTQTSLTAFGAFSFVEAAVLLVSAGVLTTLFARAERRPFQLPGGDALIVMIAGGWTALLIFYRLLDKPGLKGNQSITATVGVEWGIFIALLVALALAYAGTRMRAAEHAHREPPPQGPEDRRAPRRRDDAVAPDGEPAPADPLTTVLPEAAAHEGSARPAASTPAGAQRSAAGRRPRYPPAPGEQMSLEDPPPAGDR